MSTGDSWKGFVQVSLSEGEKAAFRAWWSSYLNQTTFESVLAGLSWQGKLSLTLDRFNDCFIATLTYGTADKNRPVGWSVSMRHSELDKAIGLLSFVDLHGMVEEAIDKGQVKPARNS